MTHARLAVKFRRPIDTSLISHGLAEIGCGDSTAVPEI
jgi:hypothetical protein